MKNAQFVWNVRIKWTIPVNSSISGYGERASIQTKFKKGWSILFHLVWSFKRAIGTPNNDKDRSEWPIQNLSNALLEIRCGSFAKFALLYKRCDHLSWIWMHTCTINCHDSYQLNSEGSTKRFRYSKCRIGKPKLNDKWHVSWENCVENKIQ